MNSPGQPVTSGYKTIIVTPEMLEQMKIALSSRIEYLDYVIREPLVSMAYERLVKSKNTAFEALAALEGAGA
jgi:hypothetical protein